MSVIRDSTKQEYRRIDTLVTSGFSSGTMSVQTAAGFCDQHYISILPVGNISAGTLRVRARPIGASGYTRINKLFEAVALTGAVQLSFLIVGFFDQFEVYSTGITGGTVSVVINSKKAG